MIGSLVYIEALSSLSITSCGTMCATDFLEYEA